MGERRAVIVGVERYLDDSVPPREGVVAPLRRIADRLEAGGWGTRLLLDDEARDDHRPLLANLLDATAWLGSASEALLLISAHIEADHVLLRDTRRQHLARTGLPLTALYAELPDHATLILDGLATPTQPLPRGWVMGGPGALQAVLRALASGRAIDRQAFLAPHLWSHGDATVQILPALDKEARACGGCGFSVTDSVATFCPNCGVSLSQPTHLDGGRYRLLKRLGKGGMGQVFLAEDTRMHEQRAIKLLSLPPGLPPEEVEGLRARMIQEARATQMLAEHTHHVVRVFDVGYSAARQEPFLVMEVLDGDTLAQRICQGPLSVTEALALGVVIAQTLGAAHQMGLIHRDLKPDNIMLITHGGRDDFIKLLDFGLVKMERAEINTVSGRMMGTLQYMSPEQLRGIKVDARADVFSLGAVLYECLSGQRAIPGTSQKEIFGVLLDRGVEPLAKICPDLPAELTTLVDRCLALDREQRPVDGLAVAQALSALESFQGLRPTLPPSAPVASTPDSGIDELAIPPTRWGWWVAAVGMVGLAIFFFWPSAPPPEPKSADLGVVVDAAPPIVDAAPPIVDATPPFKPPTQLPAAAQATVSQAGESLRYQGDDEPEVFAAIVADALLAEVAPPKIDATARARWAKLPIGARYWLLQVAGSIPVERVGDALAIQTTEMSRLRTKQPHRRSFRGLGRAWVAKDHPVLLLKPTCGKSRPGDQIATARWSTPGYGAASCIDRRCASKLARALQHGRRVGEAMTVTLTLIRRSTASNAEEERLETRCHVRP